MIKRIKFSVIKVSGEDDNFPAAELNNQRPETKGWMSPKFCTFPQVLVLRLNARTRLSKFQVLSHPFSISSKLELYVGEVKKSLPELLQNVSWEKQGEIFFSENYNTNYRARELRSARLDTLAKFVKMVLHQNHVNQLNLCNQVGIIAVNLLGEPELQEESAKTDDIAFNNRAKYATALEEIPFNMYVDSEVAQLIRKLNKKKHKAITDDRFVYAKKLKYAQNQLRKVGEKLGKLDIEKDLAVEEEDYDMAHLKNEEIEKLRQASYKKLNITTLMEVEGKRIKENDDEVDIKEVVPKPPPSEILVPMIGNFVSHDDNVVPALKKGVKFQPSVLGIDIERTKDFDKGKLTEKERREASLPIEVFGLSLVEKMYSKSFSQREEAMKDLQSYLDKYQKKQKSMNDVIRATAFLLQKALADKVFSIYTAALGILAMCFKNFIPTHQVSKLEASFLAEKSIPEIITKLGDTAPRLKNASVEYLTNQFPYSELENLQILPLYVLCPLQNVLNVRLALGRCELVDKLVRLYPPSHASHSLLSLPKVMPFLVGALQHPSSSVRGVAESTILYLYERDGGRVKKFIPFDSTQSKRNIMHRRLLQEFDKIDKKLGQKRGSGPQLKEVSTKEEAKPLIESLAPKDFLMKTCIFCEEKNEKFTSAGLDEHYDQKCPMLVRCSNCNQIVEIASFTEHLLEECESRSQYKQCPLCMEAVPALNFDDHTKIRTCTMAKSSAEANHCPLCHQNIQAGEEGWRKHLMGEEDGCAFNTRRKGKKADKKGVLKKKVKK